MTITWHTLPHGRDIFAAPLRAVPEQPCFVIPLAQLDLIEHLDSTVPAPLAACWINRGTGQPLRPGTIAMLLRTRGKSRRLSPSAERLQRWAGLRLTFATAGERNRFARTWRELRPGQVAEAA
jgi:hypothetical protein